MEKKFWDYLGIGLLVTQTICILMVFEMIFLGKPYISLFLLIFGCTLSGNISRYPNNKLVKYWPFSGR